MLVIFHAFAHSHSLCVRPFDIPTYLLILTLGFDIRMFLVDISCPPGEISGISLIQKDSQKPDVSDLTCLWYEVTITNKSNPLTL
jgi:hypothetical protein